MATVTMAARDRRRSRRARRAGRECDCVSCCLGYMLPVDFEQADRDIH